MSRMTRRRALAVSGTAITALAGCSRSSADGCSPATFGTATGTPGEPPSPCQFTAELETRGIDVDNYVDSAGVGVFYWHEPDTHDRDIRTIADAFVPYRRIVGHGHVLSFQALESKDNRHGVGYIGRGWADDRAAGQMSESEYHRKVADSYSTR